MQPQGTWPSFLAIITAGLVIFVPSVTAHAQLGPLEPTLTVGGCMRKFIKSIKCNFFLFTIVALAFLAVHTHNANGQPLEVVRKYLPEAVGSGNADDFDVEISATIHINGQSYSGQTIHDVKVDLKASRIDINVDAPTEDPDELYIYKDADFQAKGLDIHTRPKRNHYKLFIPVEEVNNVLLKIIASEGNTMTLEGGTQALDKSIQLPGRFKIPDYPSPGHTGKMEINAGFSTEVCEKIIKLSPLYDPTILGCGLEVDLQEFTWSLAADNYNFAGNLFFDQQFFGGDHITFQNKSEASIIIGPYFTGDYIEVELKMTVVILSAVEPI